MMNIKELNKNYVLSYGTKGKVSNKEQKPMNKNSTDYKKAIEVKDKLNDFGTKVDALSKGIQSDIKAVKVKPMMMKIKDLAKAITDLQKGL